mmetsp:Transcript_41666/g.116087  ORF Transcript_41666/g.116087 Transcript_41666/m.116087 type:complete len:87 (+) Transcript_41666:31-291(+)
MHILPETTPESLLSGKMHALEPLPSHMVHQAALELSCPWLDTVLMAVCAHSTHMLCEALTLYSFEVGQELVKANDAENGDTELDLD